MYLYVYLSTAFEPLSSPTEDVTAKVLAGTTLALVTWWSAP